MAEMNMAQIRKALEAEIAARKAGTTLVDIEAKRAKQQKQAASGVKPVDEDEYRNWRRRAELISLPAICPVRRCRRSRTCRVSYTVCLKVYREKAAERINLMLGWQVATIFDDEQVDLSW